MPTTQPELRSTGEDDTHKLSFEKQKAIIESRLALSGQRAAEQRARLEAAKESATEKPDPRIEKLIESYGNSVVSAERTALITKDKLDYLRPTSDEDVAYRLRVMDEFAPAVRSAAPESLPLRFHGTEIYIARDIFKSGELSSSVDRLGFTTSYDVSDQISVTTPETLETTLGSYSGLNEENFCVPPGCVFVFLPSSAEDEEAGQSMLMGNVKFEAQSQQVFAVLTAPENIPQVQEWAAAGGIDPTKVDEFFSFTEKLGTLKQQIETGQATAQQFVDYPLAS